MKKLGLVVVGLVVFATFSLTSCTKECTCVTSSNMPGAADITQTIEHKGKCSELESSVSAGGYTTTTTCN
jgi:hypothetical protein